MSDLRKLIDGYRNTALIYTAVKLDLPDKMGANSVDAEQLASLIDGSPPHLARLLDSLVYAGICDKSDDGFYTLTESGLSLRRNSASPHCELVEIAVEQYWSSWINLEHSVRTGESAFEQLYGMGVFDWRRANPGANDLFNSWLAKETDTIVNSIIEVTDFSDTERIADIGGGNGSLLAAILTQYPQLAGTLFDQAHVIEHAKKHLVQKNVFSRMEFFEGNFFSGIPVKADTYILKSVLHDWTDEKAISILKCCRDATGDDTKLMLVERLLGHPNGNNRTNIMVDIHMMAVTGGRERSLEEYTTLLDKSGFALSQVCATASGFHIIEAAPA